MNTEEIKDLVVNENQRIKLHDEIVSKTNDVISKTNEENYPVDQVWSIEEFKKRINDYEEITSDLCTTQILMSYWGTHFHSQTIGLPLRIIADYWLEKSGESIWLALKWYNNLLLLYYSGIAAIAGSRYENLKVITDKVIIDPIRTNRKTTMLQATIRVCSKYEKQFQLISGNPRHYVPRSEYLFNKLVRKFQEILHLGSDYKLYFNRFEVMIALIYAHQTAGDSPEDVSCPLGRFGYKKENYDNPLKEVVNEANSYKNDWPPIKAGLFGSSFDRFDTISSLLIERVNNLSW